MIITNKQVIDIQLPLPELTGEYVELYEILTGQRSGKDFYEAGGMLLGEQSALLRIADQRGYYIALKVGSKLYQLGGVTASNPMIQALADKMTVFGDSPQTRRIKNVRKAQAQMTDDQRMDAEKEYRRSIGQHVVEVGTGISIRQKKQEKSYSESKQRAVL